MKVVYRTAVRTFLCAGLLLGTGALARAQEPPEPTSQQASPAVDNTKVNEHDRIKSEPTADQQKDNRSDRDITQQIQQSIMNDKSLSTYAHNVKIITQNGQVTLKGQVRSDDEKRTVEAKATEVAGENKVGREIPITDMTPDQNYYGFEGGLYESGLNTVPSDHNSEGVTFAGQVQKLNARGSPSSSGKIGWLCIGFSNVDSECSNFIVQAKDSSAVNNSSIVFVDGALGGTTACGWTFATGSATYAVCADQYVAGSNLYDIVRDSHLTPAGLTEAQVEVVWFKNVDVWPQSARPSLPASNADAYRNEGFLGGILRAIRQRYPNVKLVFMSSRIYGGYAPNGKQPEPYAYETGFAVKWAIEAQIVEERCIAAGGTPSSCADATAGDLNYNRGTAVAPWVAWGAYIWADGSTPRNDGLVWCDGQSGPPCNGDMDFEADDVHPNTTGQTKVGNILMNFFSSSQVTAPWFLEP